MIAVATATLQGCVTLEALKGAADQAAEGDVITAVYTGTMGVVFGPIVDVFTLGGTLTDEQAAANVETFAAGVEAVAAAESQTESDPAAAQVAPPNTTPRGQASDAYVSRPVVIEVPNQNISVASRVNASDFNGSNSCPTFGPSYDQKLASTKCSCKGSGTSFSQTNKGFSCRLNGAISIGCSKANNSCLTQ